MLFDLSAFFLPLKLAVPLSSCPPRHSFIDAKPCSQEDGQYSLRYVTPTAISLRLVINPLLCTLIHGCHIPHAWSFTHCFSAGTTHCHPSPLPHPIVTAHST